MTNIILAVLATLLFSACDDLKPKVIDRTPASYKAKYFPTQEIDLGNPDQLAEYGAFVGTRHNRYYEFANGFMPFNEFGTLITEVEMDARESSPPSYADYDFTSPDLTLDSPETDKTILLDSPEQLIMVANTVINSESKTTIIIRSRSGGGDVVTSVAPFNYNLGGAVGQYDSTVNIILYNNDPTLGVLSMKVNMSNGEATEMIRAQTQPSTNLTIQNFDSNLGHAVYADSLYGITALNTNDPRMRGVELSRQIADNSSTLNLHMTDGQDFTVQYVSNMGNVKIVKYEKIWTWEKE